MDENRRAGEERVVRKHDVVPYHGLQWVFEVFKGIAAFLVVLAVVQVVVGVQHAGTRALPILLGGAARTFVLAVALWGLGDLAMLLIHVGRDVRTERILLSRLVSRTPARPPDEATPGD